MKLTSAILASAFFMLPSFSNAQYFGDVHVTVDAVWHNRYHSILAMAAYNPNYNEICPQATFTRAALQRSFPDSASEPWTLIETFGPTPSGAEGFNVIIPEMDKVVTVFKGNYGIENHLNTSVVNLDTALGLGTCQNCTGNAQVVQAYLEAREATNNWAIARAAVERTGHQWSLTGHGFGGQLSIVASIDLGWAGDVRWSHNNGAPLTLNQAGVDLYERLFAGEAGETGIANSDPVPYLIPAGPDYARTGPVFYYSGYNASTHMNMNVCGVTSDPMCQAPQPYNETDRFFYFTPIGECGGNRDRANLTTQERHLSSVSSAFYATATVGSTGIQSASAIASSAVVSSVPIESALPTESGLLSASALPDARQAAATTQDSSASTLQQGGLVLGSLAALFAVLL